MKCAICMMVKLGEPFDAITVRGGTAVCEHHIGQASDANVTAAIARLDVWGGKVTYLTDTQVKGETDDS